MKGSALAAVFVCASLAAPALLSATEGRPLWAYPATPRGFKPDPDDGAPKRLPGSTRAYTYKQIEDSFNPADWYPDEHPRMPDVPVASGRRPNARACAWCHLPNGLGHPQSAGLAGLPAAYMTEQLTHFKLGFRTSSVGGSIMGAIARALTDQEIKDAVEYYARLKRTNWIKVVETATVPKTRVIEGNLRIPLAPTETEPLGRRIVEVPRNPARTRMYDSHAGFVAYAPVGSVMKGQTIVSTGVRNVGGTETSDKALACATCHGADLRGMPPPAGTTTPTPALAGRSPTYIVRQLYDFQSGRRGGDSAALMRLVVAQLTVDDMIDVAAYLASRRP